MSNFYCAHKFVEFANNLSPGAHLGKAIRLSNKRFLRFRVGEPSLILHARVCITGHKNQL